jgi:hypothetical protein
MNLNQAYKRAYSVAFVISKINQKARMWRRTQERWRGTRWEPNTSGKVSSNLQFYIITDNCASTSSTLSMTCEWFGKFREFLAIDHNVSKIQALKRVVYWQCRGYSTMMAIPNAGCQLLFLEPRYICTREIWFFSCEREASSTRNFSRAHALPIFSCKHVVNHLEKVSHFILLLSHKLIFFLFSGAYNATNSGQLCKMGRDRRNPRWFWEISCPTQGISHLRLLVEWECNLLVIFFVKYQ